MSAASTWAPSSIVRREVRDFGVVNSPRTNDCRTVSRPSSSSTSPQRNPSLWPTILGLDTSSRVVFRRRYRVNNVPSGPLSLTGFVEGYGEQVMIGDDWRLSVPITPVDLQSYWILQDAVYGLLDSTTVLGY